MFTPTENATVALPVPWVWPVRLIHDRLAVAVQPQLDAEAVTVMFPLRPLAGALTVDGDTLNEQGGAGVVTAPACITLKAMPAIVSVAVRCAELVFWLAVYRTSPGPTPVSPDVTSSQDSELCAVHSQPLAAMTSTDPDPAAGPMAALGADSEN